MLRMHIASCQPNATHMAISEFASFFRQIQRRVSIITTNYDGYDKRVNPDD